MQYNRMLPYLFAAAAIGAVLVALGAPMASFLPFVLILACPLMMVFMMKGMGGAHSRTEDHTGHGCEHDPARSSDAPASQMR